MPLRSKDLDDQGVPIAFLAGNEVMMRTAGHGAIFLTARAIPLDGQIYICAGEIILRNGMRVPAEFELQTSKSRPFLKSSVWCTPDGRRTWYQLDEPELYQVLGVSRVDVFPIRWLPNRPLDHADPGPYAVDWRHN